MDQNDYRRMYGYISFLIGFMDDHGLLEEHRFTFPDGMTLLSPRVMEGEDD